MAFDVHHNCCTTFDRAQQSGTDNEGYGRLMWVHAGIASMGCGLPPIDYCPWCGTPIAMRAEAKEREPI